MKLKINGKEFPVDLNALSFGEGKAIEGALGVTLKKFSEDVEAGSISAIAALIWTFIRRDDPDFRLEEVDKLPMSVVEVIPDPEPAETPAPNRAQRRAHRLDPTKAASKPPATKS